MSHQKNDEESKNPQRFSTWRWKDICGVLALRPDADITGAAVGFMSGLCKRLACMCERGSCGEANVEL